jgi:2-oxoglutarate ferredoxin oxidoreductase subunit alpha
VEQAVGEGSSVAHLHLRHLNPLPADVGEILSRYRRVLVAENNLGQLLWLLRAMFLVDAAGYGRITGQPFSVNEIRQQIQTHLKAA